MELFKLCLIFHHEIFERVLKLELIKTADCPTTFFYHSILCKCHIRSKTPERWQKLYMFTVDIKH